MHPRYEKQSKQRILIAKECLDRALGHSGAQIKAGGAHSAIQELGMALDAILVVLGNIVENGNDPDQEPVDDF